MWKKPRITPIFLFPVLTAIFVLATEANFLTSTFLFFGVPAIFLSWKNPKIAPRILIFSATLTIPLAIIIDHFAVLDEAWYIPNPTFPFRFFGTITIENIIWAFLLAWFVILFYEVFFRPARKFPAPNHFSKLIILLGTFLAIFFILMSIRPNFHIPFAYFWSGTVLGAIPVGIFLIKKPKLHLPLLKTAGFFFFLAVILEPISLYLNHWTFPGENFVGWIEIAKFRFPIEEFVFYFCLLPITICVWWEIFGNYQDLRVKSE